MDGWEGFSRSSPRSPVGSISHLEHMGSWLVFFVLFCVFSFFGRGRGGGGVGGGGKTTFLVFLRPVSSPSTATLDSSMIPGSAKEWPSELGSVHWKQASRNGHRPFLCNPLMKFAKREGAENKSTIKFFLFGDWETWQGNTIYLVCFMYIYNAYLYNCII